MQLLNLDDYARVAAERLPAAPLGYFRGGADRGVTLAENVAAWQRLQIHPRVLVDVAERDLKTTVLGAELDWPVAIAPMACQALAHPEGELATVRAAGAMGTAMTLSTISNTAVEDVVAAASGPVWFQLYVARDRARSTDLVARAEAAGCSAIVVTADVPTLGRREDDFHTGFRLPDDLPFPNLSGSEDNLRREPARGHSSLERFTHETLDPSLDWRDIERFAASTRLPVVVKGILRPDDARRAFEHGARAIVVSNHGGRQLDTAPATAQVLRSIVEAVDDRGEVMADGGIRKGTDVLKALALGARAVLLGRPVLWGLAVDGERGARDVLDILRHELDRALALSGCAKLADCEPSMVQAPSF